MKLRTLFRDHGPFWSRGRHIIQQKEKEIMNLKEILARTEAATKAMEEKFAAMASDRDSWMIKYTTLKVEFDALKADVAAFAAGVDADAAKEEELAGGATGGSMGGVTE